MNVEQNTKYEYDERSTRKNTDLFSRRAEDAEMSVDFRACAGLHLAAHSLRNSLCVEEQLAFPL